MSTTEVGDVAWNLEPLVDGEGPAGVDRQLDEAAERATAFAAAHAGKVAAFDGPTLAAAMEELAGISELIGLAYSYASLQFSVDTADPKIGALMQKVQEKATAIETTLQFFELEWAALDDALADQLLTADGLDTSRHHLRNARRYRPHLLSEPEERILTEKSVTGRSAWSRLFSELTSAIEVTLPGEEEKVALDVALSKLYDPDRAVRAATQQAVTDALAPGLRTRAFIFNTLLADKATDDRLRNFDSWLSSRNLSNEASDESVQALIDAVKGAYELPRRWYRLKARLLGVDRLADYDRMAAVATADEEFGWDDARELVVSSFRDFSPILGDTAQGFFDGDYIDAPVRPGKRGGAFCAYVTPSAHPYVLLNWTHRRRDVLTLAHELGHGLHAALARPRGVFEQHTPLTLAETASVFGETLVFGRLLEETTDPASRLALLAENIEGSIATVFRQVAMNQFEHAVHTARRTEGELSVDRIGELWAVSQEELLGDAVEVTDNYKSWWSYVPHFVGTPGYVYAYAYGQLLALSVYGRYLEVGPAFVDDYVALLSAGGSKSPEELAAIAGLDLTDPGFWQSGIALVERQLTAAEEAAEAVLTEQR
ncbi:M3 family oligoendopeptidase [Paraconexibacter antarcticus]|uniref:M3 family oligoendopeptidase n=1 Tax=Paraconexibacter antarcticus TaxID=2949664 RepID=A0ABY5DZ15_9ACTN|nr:M3 family oligoendopeptidase [Paraconexibacter antarcticus]UTI65877.1 M3 family oligoendopeptidase [Paraconexibacter antarcticus]